MGANPQRLSGRKRLLFISMIIIGGVSVVELASLMAISILDGSIVEVTRRRQAIATGDRDRPDFDISHSMMIHPYIGTVLQPRDDGGKTLPGGEFRNTEYGFLDDGPPIHKRSPDRVIVAILGGSVARQMAINATGVLEQELSQVPRFSGKSFRFVRLAIDGNKQPQQLMTLNYLLALGAEFDIVINLDGVNEASLPGMDNVPYGVSAAFPRKWHMFIEPMKSGQVIEQVGFLVHLRHRKHDSARFFNAFPLRYSATSLLVWRTINKSQSRQIQQIFDFITAATRDQFRGPSSGPSDRFISDEQMYAHCVELWSRSSILMHQLCDANGIRYFHFLQPNQYVEGSKPMSPRELSFAISIDSPFGDPVKKCYPSMQAKATQFTESHVDFTDLTLVFTDHPEQIYKDDCCHVVPEGDAIMATAIATRIKHWYQVVKEQKQSPTKSDL